MLKDQSVSDWSFSLLDFSNEFGRQSRLLRLQKGAERYLASHFPDAKPLEVRHFHCEHSVKR